MKSVLKYIGMKDIDLSKYGFNNHSIYCEPFSGSFNTGFKLIEDDYTGKLIYNDIDERVVNFWLKLREDDDELYNRCTQLNNLLRNCGTTDDKVNIINSWAESKNSFKRAAAEYISRLYTTMDGLKLDHDKSIENVFDFYLSSKALHLVEINNLDYETIIHMYDSTHAFFLIDPPYDIDKVNTYYRGDYRHFNHEHLADVVKSIDGDWLLTYNDNEHIRELYKDYKIEEVTRQLFGKTYTELYITKGGN